MKNLYQFESCANINDCLNQLLVNGHLAVGVSRKYVHTNFEQFPHEIFCFAESEHIESLQISILTKNDRCLEKMINKEILAYSEAGLISKWINDYKIKNIVEPIQYGYINIDHIAALILFGFLLSICIAIFSFLSEILIGHRFLALGKMNVYLDDIFDGKRHYLID